MTLEEKGKALDKFIFGDVPISKKPGFIGVGDDCLFIYITDDWVFKQMHYQELPNLGVKIEIKRIDRPVVKSVVQ